MTTPAREISRTGEFTDAAVELGFCEASTARARDAARLCVIATTATSLSFVPLDLMFLRPDQLGFFLTDRLVIALACVAALMFLATAQSHRRVVTIAYAQQYAFFALNALVFAHPVLERHGGVLLPLIPVSLFMFMPGSFRAAAALCAFAPAISLVFWGILKKQPETPRDLAVIAMLIVIAYVVGAMARCQLSRMRREEYLHIERERRANQTLLEAKEAAEAGSRAKAEFLAVMSHEIRTPLSAMLGMVRLVLDGEMDGQNRQRLEMANQAAEGLRTILDDILDISRLDSGRVSFEHAPFSPGRTIEEVTGLMAARAAEKGIGFTLALAPSLPDWVGGDAARLRQVLFNLIGNAVKFTESGGVSVEAGTIPAEDGHVWMDITIRDTGIGMDAEQQRNLFQAFTQADPSINRRFGGTGLGLVICKKLVDGMGGSIDVSSTPGQGSRFRVCLPFTPATAPAAQPPAPAPMVAPKSILLAEDNPVNQAVAQAILERSGHRVTVAVDGAEAVEHATRGGFDLILMDMRMPNVDGLEAARRIRALPEPEGRVPIIALTANALHADVVRCHAAGMDAHLAKPLTSAALDQAIGRVLTLRGAPPSPAQQSCLDVLLLGTPGDPLEHGLKALGHRVFTVPRDDAALAMLAARPFDLIAVSNGDETRVRAVRAAGLGQVPLLALCPAERRDGVLAAGADSVVNNPAALATALQGILRQADEDVAAVLEPDRLARVQRLMLDSLREQAVLLAGKQPDAALLHDVAHRLKGSAANLGMTDLAAIADEVLRLAAQSNPTAEMLETARERLCAAVNRGILALPGSTRSAPPSASENACPAG